MRTTENNGFYRNAKTGKIVHVHYMLHRDGRIEACFRGTRNGKPFGRAFGASIEDFMERHMWVGREV